MIYYKKSYNFDALIGFILLSLIPSITIAGVLPNSINLSISLIIFFVLCFSFFSVLLKLSRFQNIHKLIRYTNGYQIIVINCDQEEFKEFLQCSYLNKIMNIYWLKVDNKPIRSYPNKFDLFFVSKDELVELKLVLDNLRKY